MEVWVLKLDLEGALERDGEAEDLPLSREDRLTKGGGLLLRSPVSDLDTCGHQPSIVRDRQALNLTERGTLVILFMPAMMTSLYEAHLHLRKEGPSYAMASGYLKRYVKRPQEPSLCSNGPTEKQIDIIIKESTFDEDSAFSRKVYAQAIMEKCPEQKDEPEITFEAEETEYPDNDDALVVLVRITNARVKRGMVETRSSIDILYFDTFQKLRLIVTNLLPLSSTLTGFTGDSITPFETTILPVTVKQEQRSKTMMVTFMGVNLSSAYIVILSQSIFNKLRAIVSA
ncbi:hypothetical protein BHM03_00035163 [Ensete ventricosum]|nr:hypothetical protein BHM03_00035163 [Ensete ventricosum]